MFNINIEHKINLLENQGMSVCNGQSAQQHHNAYEVFYRFLKLVKPSRILEIGTALGGFTAFLGMCKKDLELNTSILSYDIHEQHWYKDLLKYDINIKVKNIFNNQYSSLIDSSVIEYIQGPGSTIVLCDGGCKKCEFNILAPYLKLNDIIMAHDYAPNPEYFQQHIKNKIWNWHEIQDSDIQEACKIYHLKPLMRDEFLSVAWACFIKEDN